MNKQLIFIKRPEGLPERNTWNLEENAIIKPKEGRKNIIVDQN